MHRNSLPRLRWYGSKNKNGHFNPMLMKPIKLVLLGLCFHISSFAENGYKLWLRYQPIENPKLLSQYRDQTGSIYFCGSSPTLSVAKTELQEGLRRLLDRKVQVFGPIAS